MKYFILCCLLVTSTFTFAQISTPEKDNNKSVSVKKLIADAKLNSNPLVVINETMILKNGLDSLNIDPDNIATINVVKKDTEKYVEMYGPQAKNGVVFIETKEKAPQKMDDANILYLINGKESNKATVLKLNPDDIESMNVIKDKSELAKYTNENYVGIVFVKLKKL